MATFSWEILCDVIICSVVFFQMKVGKLSFISCHYAVKKVIAFNSIGFRQLWRNIFLLKFMFLCQQLRNPSGTKFPAS
jgi:hypothetical protein